MTTGAPAFSTICLLTDFGNDIYAGVMKGVIAGIAPAARVIDLSHHVPRHDVRAAAYGLWASRRYFPSGTVFCCVVDPGVGGARLALAAELEDNGRRIVVVCPDNGLLTPLLGFARRAVALDDRSYHLTQVSATFHGRDLFAPVAARLATGLPLSELGPALATEDLVRIDWPQPRRHGRGWEATVIHVDSFGNLITNLPMTSFAITGPATTGPATTGPPITGRPITGRPITGQIEEGLGPTASSATMSWNVRLGDRRIGRLARTFADAAVGSPVAYFGSGGLLELAVRQGDAASEWGAGVGAIVTVEPG